MTTAAAAAVKQDVRIIGGIQTLLERWGRWVVSGRPGPGAYRCPLADLRGGGVPVSMLDDDDALAVDAAFGALSAYCRSAACAPERGLMADAIWLMYVRNLGSYAKVAKALHLPRATARFAARDLVLCGEQWLAGRLDGSLANRS
jgi:hypothetical protein